MGQNLTGQLISATYESLVQISGSIITDGTGSDITSLDITASNAVSALLANSASVATSASFADTSTSSSYATTASFALNAGAIDSGSFMITGSVSSNTLTFEKGDGSTFSLTVDTGSAASVNTGSLLVTASISDATITFTKGDASTFNITVNNVSNAFTASIATSASHALNADNSISSSYALTASYAENAGTTVDTGSLMVTGSVTSNVLTFTKGDGSTFNLTVDTGSAGTTPNLQAVTTAGATTDQTIQITDSTTGNNILTPTSVFLNSVDNTTPLELSFTDNNGFDTSGVRFDPATFGLNVFTYNNAPITLTSDTQVTGSLEISGGASGSFSGSFQGDGSGLTGVVATAFPFTGSARITGSLGVIGPVGIAGNVDFSGSQGKFIGGWLSRGGSSTSVDQIPTANTVLSTTGNGTFNANQTYNFIAANSGFTIDSTFGSINALIAGLNNRLGPNNALYNSAIIAGQGNQIVGGNVQGIFLGGVENCVVENDQNYFPGAIIGARAGRIKSSHTGSVVLGGNGLQTTGPGQVVVPTLLISGSGGGITFPDGTTQSSAGLVGVPTLQQVTTAGATTDQSVQFTDSTTGNTIIGAGGVALNSIDDTTLLYVNFTDSNGLDTSGIGFDPATFALDIYTYNNAPISLKSSTQVTGSLRGEVNALSISSNTASLDLATGNFFTLQLVGGTDTYIDPSNISPGQTINLRVNTTGSATVSFPASVLQPSGSVYVPTTTTGVDLLTFITFDSSILYLNGVKNLI